MYVAILSSFCCQSNIQKKQKKRQKKDCLKKGYNKINEERMKRSNQNELKCKYAQADDFQKGVAITFLAEKNS